MTRNTDFCELWTCGDGSKVQGIESNVKSNESVVESNESAVESNESVTESNESAVESNESNAKSNESVAESIESAVESDESNAKSNESVAESIESAVESNESVAYVDALKAKIEKLSEEEFSILNKSRMFLIIDALAHRDFFNGTDVSKVLNISGQVSRKLLREAEQLAIISSRGKTKNKEYFF